MTLPLSTHRGTVLRADGLDERDSYDDPPTWTPVARNVRAVIAAPKGSERTARAEAETLDALLSMDPVDSGLTHQDRIQDDEGTVWTVTWAVYRTGLGLDHWAAGLARYHGQEP